jgi:hypothetical protein
MEREIYHVQRARESFSFEDERDEILANYYKNVEKKSRRKLREKKVGVITIKVLAIAAVALMATLGPKCIEESQATQLQKAYEQTYDYAYKRIVTKDVIANGNKEYYEEQKKDALEDLKKFNPGTPEYTKSQHLLDEAEQYLMVANDSLSQNGPTR